MKKKKKTKVKKKKTNKKQENKKKTTPYSKLCDFSKYRVLLIRSQKIHLHHSSFFLR